MKNFGEFLGKVKSFSTKFSGEEKYLTKCFETVVQNYQKFSLGQKWWFSQHPQNPKVTRPPFLMVVLEPQPLHHKCGYIDMLSINFSLLTRVLIRKLARFGTFENLKLNLPFMHSKESQQKPGMPVPSCVTFGWWFLRHFTTGQADGRQVHLEKENHIWTKLMFWDNIIVTIVDLLMLGATAIDVGKVDQQVAISRTWLWFWAAGHVGAFSVFWF